ncbi:MAG: peptidoglycan-associated lipoprotein Pal [Maricaulaceae bacterium]|nr:peptidoglycan-associated lipoprotein Pal [Maricaulaceae bacterium]
MKIQFLIVAGLAAMATACASRPPVTDTTTGPTTTGPTTTQPTGPTGPRDGSIEQFVQVAGDRVFYGFDRYDLTPEARETLRRQAAWLNQYPGVSIQIAGNCDERGTREYNLALGHRRANAARDYLISQGVSASRISTVSYGKERPTCHESNERCWAVNRNATTVITGGAVG